MGIWLYRWKFVAYAMFAIALVLVIANLGFVFNVTAALFMIAAVFIWYKADRKQLQEHEARLLQARDQEILRALGHYRHDWMNDLQVLFGYISLKKYEKLGPYLEKIKSKLGEESHISNVGHTSLSLLLMSYRMYCQNFDLQLSLDKSIRLNTIPLRPDRLVSIVRSGLDLFRQSTEPPASAEPNVLELRIMTTADFVELVYSYTGELDSRFHDTFEDWIAKIGAEEGVQGEYTTSDGTVDLIVRIEYE